MVNTDRKRTQIQNQLENRQKLINLQKKQQEEQLKRMRLEQIKRKQQEEQQKLNAIKQARNRKLNLSSGCVSYKELLEFVNNDLTAPNKNKLNRLKQQVCMSIDKIGDISYIPVNNESKLKDYQKFKSTQPHKCIFCGKMLGTMSALKKHLGDDHGIIETKKLKKTIWTLPKNVRENVTENLQMLEFSLGVNTKNYVKKRPYKQRLYKPRGPYKKSLSKKQEIPVPSTKKLTNLNRAAEILMSNNNTQSKKRKKQPSTNNYNYNTNTLLELFGSPSQSKKRKKKPSTNNNLNRIFKTLEQLQQKPLSYNTNNLNEILKTIETKQRKKGSK